MEIATWILVVILSIALFVFLVAGIVLAIKLIQATEEAKKVIATSQQIATKADDIVDNVKGMTSVGGIVKNFAVRAMENQAKRYAAEDAAEEAEMEAAAEQAKAEAKVAAKEAAQEAKTAETKSTGAKAKK